MYKLEYVLVKDSGVLRELNLSNSILGDVLREWSHVDIVVSSPNLEGLQYVRASDHVILKNNVSPITTFVSSPAFKLYPIKEFKEFSDHNKVTVADFFSRGFDYDSGSYDRHESITTTSDDDKDLMLTGGYIDYVTTAKNNLISINGLIHPMSGSSERLCVLGAMDNITEEKNFTAQFIDFTALGGLEFHPINKATRIYPHSVSDISEQGIYVRIPDSWVGRTIGLVLFGHLHLLDRTYGYFENNIVHISLKDLDIPSKLMKYHRHLGICNLGKYINGELGRVDMLSDSLLEHAISHKNTFLFATKAKEILRRERSISELGFPGVGQTVTQCENLMMHSSGKVVEYVESYQAGVWVYRFKPELNSQTLMQTTNYAKHGVGVRGINPDSGYTWSMPMAVDFFSAR